MPPSWFATEGYGAWTEGRMWCDVATCMKNHAGVDFASVSKDNVFTRKRSMKFPRGITSSQGPGLALSQDSTRRVVSGTRDHLNRVAYVVLVNIKYNLHWKNSRHTHKVSWWQVSATILPLQECNPDTYLHLSGWQYWNSSSFLWADLKSLLVRDGVSDFRLTSFQCCCTDWLPFLQTHGKPHRFAIGIVKTLIYKIQQDKPHKVFLLGSPNALIVQSLLWCSRN